MMRLPRELGLQTLVLLANLKGRFLGTLTYEDLRRWAFDHYTDGHLPREMQMALSRARGNDEAYSGNMDTILEEVSSASNTDYDRARGALGDLADRLADILTSTFPRNVLGGSQLRQLRKALLRADELQGLVAKLRKQELCCGGCGRTLTDMEMTTVRVDGEGVTLYCKRCLTPSYVACSGCEEGHTPLTKAQIVVLGKTTDCGHATKVATEDAQADLNAPPPAVLPRAARRFAPAMIQWTPGDDMPTRHTTAALADIEQEDDE